MRGQLVSIVTIHYCDCTLDSGEALDCLLLDLLLLEEEPFLAKLTSSATTSEVRLLASPAQLSSYVDQDGINSILSITH